MRILSLALLLAGGCTHLSSGSASGLRLRLDPVLRQGDEVRLYVSLRAEGSARIEVTQRPALGGESRVLESRTIEARGDATLLFAFPARERGAFVLRVSAGDAVQEAGLRVLSCPLRVLSVEQPPRYEWRFLKNALLRDPEIAARCFLASADESFAQEHTKSDPPLFPEPLREFPRTLEALLDFDVLILGDVDPGRLGPDGPRLIERFVSEFGGGLVSISGTQHNPSAYSGTPLGNLLPVEAGEGTEGSWEYRLTDAGRRHPIVRFRGPDLNLKVWEDRPGLKNVRWIHSVKALREGAVPLVEAHDEGKKAPLFVVGTRGAGRVFWSATDETWLWRYLVGDHPWFYPFWRGVIDWAAGGP